MRTLLLCLSVLLGAGACTGANPKPATPAPEPPPVTSQARPVPSPISSPISSQMSSQMPTRTPATTYTPSTREVTSDPGTRILPYQPIGALTAETTPPPPPLYTSAPSAPRPLGLPAPSPSSLPAPTVRSSGGSSDLGAPPAGVVRPRR